MKLFPDPSRHLGEVLEPSPTPWGTPTSARPGSDFKVFYKRHISRHSKISHFKLFCDPSRYLGELLEPSPTPWGTPKSARPGTDFRAYLNRKTLLSLPAKAILAFK